MDDLGEGAAGDFVVIATLVSPTGVIIQCVRQVKFFFKKFFFKVFFFDSTIIIAIDDGRVAFAKVGGTVCVVADTVGRDILIFVFVCDIAIIANSGADRSAGAFSINVCVDNGIAGAAVDVDVTGAFHSFARRKNYFINLGTNRRAMVAGSIMLRRILRIVGAKGIDRIYGAAGDVDGCCAAIGASSISDCGGVIGTDSCNVGILFNIDREIIGVAMLSGTDGAAIL